MRLASPYALLLLLSVPLFLYLRQRQRYSVAVRYSSIADLAALSPSLATALALGAAGLAYAGAGAVHPGSGPSATGYRSHQGFERGHCYPHGRGYFREYGGPGFTGRRTPEQSSGGGQAHVSQLCQG